MMRCRPRVLALLLALPLASCDLAARTTALQEQVAALSTRANALEVQNECLQFELEDAQTCTGSTRDGGVTSLTWDVPTVGSG
jgi:hypothetical protein